MGKFFDEIPQHVIPWVKRQKMFWVATAPLSEQGHVNVSPKGFEGTFHIVDRNKVWYEDMSGSGIETISHLRENGRMTIMFCAFEGAPQIVRLFGTGTFHEYDSPEYNALIPMERRSPGSRAVIVLDIHKVGTSCGFSIPFYTFKDNRMVLHNMAAKKENEDIQAASCSPGENDSDIAYPERGLKHYWKNHNVESIDGLPALSEAFNSPKVFNVYTPEKKPTSGATLENISKKSSIADFFDTRLLTGVAIGAAATAAASFAFIRLNAH